jgi:outer membrane protein OmpA-like peptidoglycan-associated protein
VPNETPTSVIQDLNQAPEGLSGAQGGTQYGGPVVDGPDSSAEPPQEELAPIPEAGIQTQQSDAGLAEPAASAIAPANDTQLASAAPQESTASAAAPEEPAASVATKPQAKTPAVTPQAGARPLQPDSKLSLAPGTVQTPSLDAQQAGLPASAHGPNYQALAPDSYGVSFPKPVLPPYQPYNPAQAMYRSPYANPPTNYGGAGAAVVVAPSPVAVPSVASYGQPTSGQATYGQPTYGGQPVGLIYFRDGSSRLSSDDRKVLKQIAEMQRAQGGVVQVVGHASMRTRTMDYARHQQANQRISEARAKAVGRQLARYGVPQSAIRTAAVGATQPIYAEVMPSGEAANRRAEVYLTAY